MSCAGDNWIVPGANPCSGGGGGTAGVTQLNNFTGSITIDSSDDSIVVSNQGGLINLTTTGTTNTVQTINGISGNLQLTGTGLTTVSNVLDQFTINTTIPDNVNSLNGLQGVVSIGAGTGMEVVPSGNTLVLNSTVTAGVETLNTLSGGLSLVGGTNVTITPGINTITISATAGAGGVSSVNGIDGAVNIISGNPMIRIDNDIVNRNVTLNGIPMIINDSFTMGTSSNSFTYDFTDYGVSITPPYQIATSVTAGQTIGKVPYVTYTKNTENAVFTVVDAITNTPMNGCTLDFILASHYFTPLPLILKTFTFPLCGGFNAGPGVISDNVMTLQSEITNSIPNDYFIRNNPNGVNATMSFSGTVYGANIFPQYQSIVAGCSQADSSLANLRMSITSGGNGVKPVPIADWGTVIPNAVNVINNPNMVLDESKSLWYTWRTTTLGVNSELEGVNMSLVIQYMGY
jgi:hypothetical protein